MLAQKRTAKVNYIVGFLALRVLVDCRRCANSSAYVHSKHHSMYEFVVGALFFVILAEQSECVCFSRERARYRLLCE